MSEKLKSIFMIKRQTINFISYKVNIIRNTATLI